MRAGLKRFKELHLGIYIRKYVVVEREKSKSFLQENSLSFHIIA